jgi:arylsulfatase A-like enzyme
MSIFYCNLFSTASKLCFARRRFTFGSVSSPKWAGLAVGLIVPLVLVGVWKRLDVPAFGEERPRNVLILTLDTTRADRLGAYGFPDANTPNLDTLAKEGVVFEQVETAAPLTLPAHATLLTGRFPFQHGVRDNGMTLGPSETTLAQVLQARGFRTGAFVAAYVLDARWGLARGFDAYDGHFSPRRNLSTLKLEDVRRPADEVVTRSLDWLGGVGDSSFFGWIHFYDAHAPYDPIDRPAERLPGYQGAISFIDSQIGRLRAFLDARQLTDRTLLVVVGDHGESLGAHGERTHGLFVYEAVMRVPLIVRAPAHRLRGRRVRDVVRTVDLMPTVLDLLGIHAPQSLAGTSLVSRMSGSRSEQEIETYSETMYPRYHFGWSDLYAIRAGRFKLIAAPHPELYDLELDPEEAHNLYQRRPELAIRLSQRLHARETGGHGEAGRAATDHDARARVSSLGYVSGSTLGEELGPLADPKDRLAVYEQITGERQRHRVDP